MTRVTGYDVFRFYKTLKLHFNQKSYCAVKYGYNTKMVSRVAYERIGKQSYMYDKLAKQFNTRIGVHRYIACQLFWDSSAFIGNINDLKFGDNMDRWVPFKQFLRTPDYFIRDSLVSLQDYYTIQDIIYGTSKTLPVIVTKGMNHKNHFAYIASALIHHTEWDSKVDEINSNIIWDMTRDRLKNLSPFVTGSKDPTKYNATKEILESFL